MLPALTGTIRHRLLVTYAADPAAIAPLLPPPFEPELVEGHAVVGVCVLGLDRLRPRGLPSWTGASTVAAAHRIAVRWEAGGGTRRGVWVQRRDTDRRLPVLLGGRVFPGVHRPAEVEVADTSDRGLRVRVRARDGALVRAECRPGGPWTSRLFDDPAAASAFFAGGDVGVSHDRRGRPECVRLDTEAWRAEPVALEAWTTAFDEALPSGAARLDHGLLVRDVPMTWAPGGSIEDTVPHRDRPAVA